MTDDDVCFVIILLEIVVIGGLLIWCAVYGFTEKGKERAKWAAERREFLAYVGQQAEKHFSENSEYECIKRIINLRQEEKEEERKRKEEEKRRRRHRVIYVPV